MGSQISCVEAIASTRESVRQVEALALKQLCQHQVFSDITVQNALILESMVMTVIN